MTSENITERLRANHAWDELEPLCHEAADEIDRLTEQSDKRRRLLNSSLEREIDLKAKADALAEAVRAYPTYISTAIRRALTAYGEK